MAKNVMKLVIVMVGRRLVGKHSLHDIHYHAEPVNVWNNSGERDEFTVAGIFGGDRADQPASDEMCPG